MGVATFNWTYKSGSVLPYTGFVVPTTADDVKPANLAYVAPWGNNATGNGSRKYPYKTISQAINAGNSAHIICGSGVYREQLPGLNGSIYGDGNCVSEGTGLTYFLSPFGGNSANLINFKVRNFLRVFNNANSPGYLYNCHIFNSNYNFSSSQTFSQDTIFENMSGTSQLFEPSAIGQFQNCTIVNCLDIRISWNSSTAKYTTRNIIFKRCNILFLTASNIDFSLFHQCNARFAATATTPTVLYPSIPTGYTQINTLGDLQSAHLAGYPSLVSNFPNCKVVDPLFNNEPIGDYSLSMVSPAKNMSYSGLYIGAKSIATSLKIRSNPQTSDFDNSSAVNLTIADDSLTLIDVNQVGSIVTKPVSNLSGRVIFKFPVLGFNADRNGEFVDATSDLSATTISDGTTLLAATPYLVEAGAITYNGVVYQPGDRFTSLATNPGTFTTTVSGVLREITEAPARENVEIRFSNGDVSFTASGNISVGDWYFVENASITYDGVVYNVGSFFKGSATTTFTGAGSARRVFSNNDPYFYFEINQQPTSNNVGDSRTGAIIKGNGDKDFDRTASKVFPINQKFIQAKYTIQHSNLKS